MKRSLITVVLTLSVLFLGSSLVKAETWISDYGYYHFQNEISAKDRIIPHVDNIFDFKRSPNPGGESIEKGRYFIETSYIGKQDGNGEDKDYIYLDQLVTKQDLQSTSYYICDPLHDRVELQFEMWLLDTKNTRTSFYVGQDFGNDVGFVGIKFAWKLGKSYVDKLEERIRALEENRK